MKIMLLAGLYLFFVRVLWSVFSELRDPRTVARKRRDLDPVPGSTRATSRQVPQASPELAPISPTPAAPATVGHAAPVAMAVAQAAGQVRFPDSGAVYALGSQITLGRADTNGVILNDTYVSTVHARIFLTNGTYFVEDLASRNGSSLNGQEIVATTALVPGDVLQFGATTMEFS